MSDLSGDVIQYIYKMAATRGATGYAACRPEPAMGFEKGLEILEKRPLDTFLHKYLLEILLEKSVKQWRAYASQALERNQETLAALALEAVAIVPTRGLEDILPKLAKLAAPWHEASPLPILSQKFEKNTAKVFLDNIYNHKKLGAMEIANLGEIKTLATAMAQCQGTLERERAGMPSVCDEQPPADAASVYAAASELLAKHGIAAKGEMRHEASLCPIALLKDWRLGAGVAIGRNRHVLAGKATAYGRGLKLAQARASCNMEIVERVCAHAQVETGGDYGAIGGRLLRLASYIDLAEKGIMAVAPSELGALPMADELPLFWLEGQRASGGAVYVPAQAVYLFCNLDEAAVFEHIGSTGLASGSSGAMAKLAALVEVLERDAQATTPFIPEACFELQSRDAIIGPLLADYSWRGIHLQFQDISNEFGLPVYRAFVQGMDGKIAQATGAGLSGAKAALAALTETPWPYSWANPAFTPSGAGLPDLPMRMLDDLPDYSLPSVDGNLELLEKTLAKCGYNPVYVDLSRPEFPFPVFRAFIPGMANDTDLDNGPSRRLLARYLLAKGKYNRL